ncbi:hypothetical protein N9H39_11620 [Gammaproteobacteria bacterium]|nr:hypothetical protein [Gammaproteobacteria bacterium]
MSRAPAAMLALSALVSTSTSGAESNDARYFALTESATWTYEYRFRVEGQFSMEQVGKTVNWIDGIVERGGHQYYRMRTKTTGFQNAPSGEVFIRIAEDSLRAIEPERDPTEKEVLSLPLPAIPGSTWSIGEGAETWHYTLESIEPVEVPAGRFEDCIAIVFTLESKTSEFEISARKEHCAGVGMVRHRTKAVSEHGTSYGEYTLLEHKP